MLGNSLHADTALSVQTINIFQNTVEPANNGHPRDWPEWPLCKVTAIDSPDYPNVKLLIALYLKLPNCSDNWGSTVLWGSLVGTY